MNLTSCLKKLLRDDRKVPNEHVFISSFSCLISSIVSISMADPKLLIH